MAKDSRDLLKRVPISRRTFVKRLLGGAFAVPIVSSFALSRVAAAGEWSGLANPAGHYPGWSLLYAGGYAANPAGNVPPGWNNANTTNGTRTRGGRG